MNAFFNKIRQPKKNRSLSQQIINTVLICLLGVILGVFSKWLDNLSVDNSIGWQHIIGILDLRNVFSGFGIWILIAICISVWSYSPLRAGINVFTFFAGMTVSYHLYTIFFSGFNPKSYMMIWYGITLFTPILGFICWYAKGNGKIAFAINVVILSAMMFVSFGIGMWYFDFISIIDTLLFLGTWIVLYMNPKRSIFSFIGAVILAFILVLLRLR